MGDTINVISTIFPYLTGGAGGALITWGITWFRNRTQTMMCKYIDDEILSKLPIQQDDGTQHENIYVKYFELLNTTNIDIEEFKVIFQFDKTATILEYIDRTKSGTGKHKMKRTKDKPNECIATIKNFIRKDKITFTFKIANINEDLYYVSEDDCIKFKIRCKDYRKKKLATKAKRSSNVLSISDNLNKAEDE